MKDGTKKMFGDNPKESNTIARIVNKQHSNRIKSLLNEPNVKESVVFGGSIHDDDLYVINTLFSYLLECSFNPSFTFMDHQFSV